MLVCMASAGEGKAAAKPKKPSSGYIVGPIYDAVFFLYAPLFALVIGILISYTGFLARFACCGVGSGDSRHGGCGVGGSNICRSRRCARLVSPEWTITPQEKQAQQGYKYRGDN